MKKFFFIVTLILCGATVAFAQSDKKFRIGATGGMNISSTTGEYADSKIGFQIGVRGEYNFSESL